LTKLIEFLCPTLTEYLILKSKESEQCGELFALRIITQKGFIMASVNLDLEEEILFFIENKIKKLETVIEDTTERHKAELGKVFSDFMISVITELTRK